MKGASKNHIGVNELYTNREDLIQELLNHFDHFPEVTNVVLRGSIVSGKTDRFSDIDLLIKGTFSNIETIPLF